MLTQCEGWRRTGGAFSFGPVKWEQCTEHALFILEFIQEGEEERMPACMTCLNEALNTKSIEVKKVELLPSTDHLLRGLSVAAAQHKMDLDVATVTYITDALRAMSIDANGCFTEDFPDKVMDFIKVLELRIL